MAKAKAAADNTDFVNPEENSINLNKKFKTITQYFTESAQWANKTLWPTTKKKIAYVVTLIVMIAIMSFNHITPASMVKWGMQAFSNASHAHVINVGPVNAKFTKSFWFMGTPEVKFWNPMVEGILTSNGSMKFELIQTNGVKAIIKGTVAIENFDPNKSGAITFMGDGISGNFNMIVDADGNTTINGFELNVNLDMVD